MTIKIGKLILALAMVLVLHTMGFAALTATTQSYDIKVNVPEVDGISVALSKVDNYLRTDDQGKDDQWTKDVSSLTFGEPNQTLEQSLVWYEDPDWHDLKCQVYYAVDVGVRDNSGKPWELSVDKTSIVKEGGTTSLDKYFAMAYKKMIKGEDPTGKDDVQNDIQPPFNKATLAGGWLRAYCGLSGGLTSSGALKGLPLDMEVGNYKGSLTVTLTPL